MPRSNVDCALDYLHANGHPEVTMEALCALALKRPWLRTSPQGWRGLVREFVESGPAKNEKENPK